MSFKTNGVITFTGKGDFEETTNFLKKIKNFRIEQVLDYYGKKGVAALSSATPVDTGKTASSWGYEIKKDKNSISIEWTNSNINKGVNIAVILQYGHGTTNGGYVKGIDYINPAMRPIFEEIKEKVWKEVSE